MPVRTFDFCVLQFLNQWLEKETKICDSLASDERAIQQDALVQAGGHFRIASNLPTTRYGGRKDLSLTTKFLLLKVKARVARHDFAEHFRELAKKRLIHAK